MNERLPNRRGFFQGLIGAAAVLLGLGAVKAATKQQALPVLSDEEIDRIRREWERRWGPNYDKMTERPVVVYERVMHFNGVRYYKMKRSVNPSHVINFGDQV